MQCPQCQSQISGSPKFCPECGAPLADAQPQMHDPAQINRDPASQDPSMTDASMQNDLTAHVPPAPNSSASIPVSAPAPQPMGAAPKQPWYGKTWVIILFLLFLWPVGLVFMWLRTCSWQKPVKIVVSILIGLSVIWGIFNVVTLLSLNASTSTTDAPKSAALEPRSDSTSDKSKATDSSSAIDTDKQSGTSSATSTSKQVGNVVVMDDCWNGDIPTLYGLVNLTGNELASMLEGKGFAFTKENNLYSYGNIADNGAYVRFANGDAAYAPSAVSHLDSLGIETEPLEISLFRNSTPDAMAQSGNLEFEKSKTTTDGGLFIGIAKDAFDNDILGLGVQTDKGYTKFMLVNEAYVADGYLNTLLDSTKSPSSIQAFWDQYMKENPSGWK